MPRAIALSSNGWTTAPIVWPVSWPLPAITSTSPGPSSCIAVRIARGAVADLARRRAAGADRGADRRRILAARIVRR